MATGTLNKVMLIGHTGDDVKVQYFDNGGSIGRFPLATNEEYLNKSTGQRVRNTEWHNIVVRNKAAEICEKYLNKGDKVYVEGRIKTRKWTDDKGMERYTTEIQCTEFTFLTPKDQSGNLGGNNNGNNNQNFAKPENKPSNQVKEPQNFGGDEDEDDLPF